MKHILITSTDVMMIQFLVPHILHLKQHGFCVDIACSSAAGYQGENYLEKIKKILGDDSDVSFVRTERNPLSFRNYLGYKDLAAIIDRRNYDLIWTNEPVMSVMTRLAARKARKKNHTKLLYLVHGFHFFKGAPKINWIVYPIEKFMARYCDAMTMINWEDYHFTQKHFGNVPVYHIDGIGLDVTKFSKIQIDTNRKRLELGFTADDILLLSVGELQYRKNHAVVIRALAELKNPNVKYIICGCGALKDHLLDLAEKLGVKKQLYLLGHRYDIAEILKTVDVFVHPSIREGLGIAAIEAMSAGLPIITSNVQGIVDYSKNDLTGYCLDPNDVQGFTNALKTVINNKELRTKMGHYNIEASKKYDISNSCVQVESIINNILAKS